MTLQADALLLRCPYCAGTLTAKKGRKIAHHFAHTEQTCAAVAGRANSDELPLLPLYTEFALTLGKRELETLHSLWHGNGHNSSRLLLDRLLDGGYLQFNRFIGRSGDYEFTKLGKIPVGGLSVPLFADIQRERWQDRLERARALSLAQPSSRSLRSVICASSKR